MLTAPERRLSPPAAFQPRPSLRTYRSRLPGEFPYAPDVATALEPDAGEAFVLVEDFGTDVIATIHDPVLACHGTVLSDLTDAQIHELRRHQE